MSKRRNPTAEDLIVEEEENFIQRFEVELIKLAIEGVAFNLPAVVVDHIANTEENLSWVKSKIKKCAREGIKEGEGLKMFKIRTTQVPAEEEGRSIIRTELMIFVRCTLSDAHHAIYRELNQKVATRLRLSAYVFDLQGCKYPDRTVSGLPINIQQIRERLQVNPNMKNPVYIDIKADRARAEDRQHQSKRLKGGYPVEKITGKADLPSYQKTLATQSVLSTLSGPPGLLIGEKNGSVWKKKGSNYDQFSQLGSTNGSLQISNHPAIPSTLNGPSGLLIGEGNKSTITSTNITSNSRHRPSLNAENRVPSTLNGPPGLLIGEGTLKFHPSSGN